MGSDQRLPIGRELGQQDLQQSVITKVVLSVVAADEHVARPGRLNQRH